MGYLTPEIRKGFDRYKYNSMDTSPFSNYVMHPFWNAFTKLLPMRLAANTMTFVGFLLLPLNFIVLTYYDPDFLAHSSRVFIPSWVWAMCAFNNFMSHTLDGCDGKQARRTGTSSALGELFDHGLDAWSTSFFAIAVYDVFGRGEWGAPPFRFLIVLVALQCTFLFTHWEKYNTGVLYLPWGYDPAITAMTVIYSLTWWYGIEFWEHRIIIFHYNLTIANILESILYFANFGVSVPVCIFNVLFSYYNKSGRMLSLMESVRPLVPIFIYFPAIIIWAINSPNSILENHPRCFYSLAGIIFANITSRLIMNQMSHTRPQIFNKLLIPLSIISMICSSYNLAIYETYILYGFTAVSLFVHCHYGYHVVQEIAEHLNINVFSVDKKPPRTAHKSN